ncbi:MAG: 2-C-methyl-D-erythritol 2,4-cyclodiphosphate synthase [Candidatus Marinimicrobia bacterium]|jgi:2-C-methyl-D-erythritol 2,4-cyclodiphosphate synthase|nr:2-C-methyl-D-erythritol 2,4-cyclodiphosphate synthase [Candidatus Neomarinimicrobiota bacterium]
MVKTGIGYDVHSLKKGESLLLGGVKISSSIGVIAHSDGDVLLHAMVDALLGAAALGDLGKYFPSSDAQWKEKSSLFFLRYAAELLFKKGYNIDHIDSTIVLERPKISDKISEMIANISNAIKLEKSSISIKSTTTDGLGFIGKNKGIGVLAIATISK